MSINHPDVFIKPFYDHVRRHARAAYSDGTTKRSQQHTNTHTHTQPPYPKHVQISHYHQQSMLEMSFYAGDSGVSSILYGSWFTLAMAGGGGPQDTWRAPRGRRPLVRGVDVASGRGVEGTVAGS
uniref:(northern house mosquito) hypothetical protein n=1 Tax=Culex pipiens TaxID=7175 RepID=A0A8D8KI34_CULPI